MTGTLVNRSIVLVDGDRIKVAGSEDSLPARVDIVADLKHALAMHAVPGRIMILRLRRC